MTRRGSDVRKLARRVRRLEDRQRRDVTALKRDIVRAVLLTERAARGTLIPPLPPTSPSLAGDGRKDGG